MISDAIIRTITRWLPTLDEARLREVEDFVLAKAIEQQDSAPSATVVPHDGQAADGGTFRDDEKPGSRQSGPHETQQGAATPGQCASMAAGNVAEPQTGSASARCSSHSPSHLSAAGRHGAQRDAVTGAASSRARVPCETPTGGTFPAPAHPSNGSHRVGGGDSRGWGEGRCLSCGHHSAVHFHAAPNHCLAFLDGMERSCDCPGYIKPLRLRDTPPDLNSAEMWSAEMVDERFDDSEGGEK